jgi:hypothetical protein
MAPKRTAPKKTASRGRTAAPKRAPASFSFDAAKLVKELLAEVPERAREVLTMRFGLGASTERETLEAIGERWSITRERVRQIEAAALEAIRGSAAFEKAAPAFEELAAFVHTLGVVVEEEELLAGLGKDEKVRNRFRFLLVAGSAFFRERESDHFYARWHVDAATAEQVHQALSRLYASLDDEAVVAEGELLSRFLEELREVNDAYKNEEVLKRWLSLSKTIGCNPLGEWGKAHAPAIRTKGIRDYAYLVIKRSGEPMHFSDVAKAIGQLFAKQAHVATTHNELIKDERFVLVGRGLYALSEWGYQPGVVREVIRGVLAANGPMTRDQVIEAVKKVRYVKDNTILVNLNDARYFARSKNGMYSVAI